MPDYGFNFQWMFSYQGEHPQNPDERALDFMAEQGFNFVRIPTDYNFWTTDFNYFELGEAIFDYLDRYLEACRTNNFKMSLNLHRAPGYCINRNDLEKHNLWLDEIAQDAFVFLWEMFATRYKGIDNQFISFDLLNEPAAVGDFGLTRDNHASLIRRTVEAIRAVDPQREIVIDGLAGGHVAMPELADLNIIHSGRGYQPMPVSHWGATWWDGWKTAPSPTYPNTEWDDKVWDKQTIHEHYQSWREVEAMGATIHIGEFGCFNQTPNDVALRWFDDILSLYQQYGWGYALWNFEGAFGIIDHGRKDARIEQMGTYQVDRDLLDLLKHYRTTDK